MEIIEIKGDKQSKSRYKTILGGIEKKEDEYEAFISTADKKSPRARFSSGDIVVRGRSKEKVVEQIMTIVAAFPPEHNLNFLDLTKNESEAK